MKLLLNKKNLRMRKRKNILQVRKQTIKNESSQQQSQDLRGQVLLGQLVP